MGVSQGPKYMLQRVVNKWRFWNLTEPAKYGSGPIAIIKNAYAEQPTVFLSFILGSLGPAALIWGYYENERTGYLENHAYKKYYTVMRPDDERVAAFKAEWFENGIPPTTKVSTRM
eukprot:TRINITY_DN18834_c0_g3_i1.p2 TRINITY_DN18834_c0_g3~~TRINITY_DN18834_c0_g3_i1.p2  ORF type:complete len:116 (+),score=6.86 TRINITY_DN18834_c0_g3_i1:32-379(+)